MILVLLIVLIIVFIFINQFNIIEGGKNMELVGQGWGAKVYKLDDKTALRRVKVYPSDQFDKSQDCWTELEFYEFINKLEPEYKKHFMTLYKYEFKKIKPHEFEMEYKHKTKHTAALTKSNVVLDQYITFVPTSLIIKGNPNPLLFKDYENFIKTIYKCLFTLESNGWEYKDLHLGNIMVSDTGDYVLIDYDSAAKRTKNNMVASKIFIIKSLMFIDDKLGIPKFIGKIPIYDFVVSKIDEKMRTKIEKLINNPRLETDLLIPYNYLKGYEDTLKLDMIIYLNLFDRKQFFDIIGMEYKPMISDKIIPLLFEIIKSNSYEEIIKLL